MKRLVFSLLFLGLFVSAAAAQTTIFIVRHAEKANNEEKDPNLSEAGCARAVSLATTLKDAGIAVIYATDLKRTQQTAAPLAKILGLQVVITPAKDTTALVARLLLLKGNALVIGHGNTIPELVQGLGIATPINIAEADYDNIFVVALGQTPRMVRLHYP